MNKKREREEYLEVLWRIKEDGIEDPDYLKNAFGSDFEPTIIEDLEQAGHILTGDNGSIVTLTDAGYEYARKIIRAHRIAEKLICDALGGDFESGACEFEHILNTDLVDSICVLLGHPRRCPHGKPIPQGDCCKTAARTVQSPVMPLTELESGMSGRVAFINYSDDMQIYKMDTLKIKPGGMIKLLQKSPSFVVSCEGGDVALDDAVASNILLWKEGGQFNAGGENMLGPGKCRRKRGFGFMRRKSA
ncbi:Iron-dependent repressor [Desulfamplus magnetovallimortis]|uniref:Iron-dependent repressor n=2 Tax=Desulfamplus magnetovallimortis TaxID=1246637 RepID=A0A1W1HI23_9BACT|nr:iron dependent repressor, metal binding and dimerization domain protein [Desulfamplus magnetovallimortis]AGG16188.1 magnetosome protein Mad30 [Desulfamplus magnetovallimortis BW-1]SLM32073.1 Iron-dependent repressor [Desulfamplus magnetovallimortis]